MGFRIFFTYEAAFEIRNCFSMDLLCKVRTTRRFNWTKYVVSKFPHGLKLPKCSYLGLNVNVFLLGLYYASDIARRIC